MLARLLSRYVTDIAGLSIILLVQALGLVWILRVPAAHASRQARRAIIGIAAVSAALVVLGFALRFLRVMNYFSPWWYGWGRGLMLAWGLMTMLLVVSSAIAHALPRVQSDYTPARRNFLRVARAALFAAPAAVIGYGVFIERLAIRMREQDIAIPDLHPDLEGLRVVQVSDIHLSPFLSIRDLERVVDMANETRAHLALVTGDLISTAADPVDQCLNRLKNLRSDAGTFGCLGNHEIYAGCEDYVTERGARLGMNFLRMAAEPLRFGNATMNLAGVDYQHLGRPYLVGADKLIAPGTLNVLLSHNPDVFRVAARQGWDFTIAGHTHGGQIRVEILHQNLSIARFFTPYVDGLYRRGRAAIFVSRGIGTIGAPIRLDCPPEVVLLKLCRASS